jgi:hypothetical protein
MTALTRRCEQASAVSPQVEVSSWWHLCPPDLDAELRRGLASLRWAEQQGLSQAGKAAHIRQLLDDLVEDVRAERKDQLRAEIESLSQQIRAARAKIRRRGGPGLASAVIRMWAKQQGIPVKSSGGPLPSDVIDAFERALGADAHLHRKTIAIARTEADIASLVMRRTNARGQLHRLRSSALPAAVIRAWARAQGLDVPDSGRLPQGVIDAYNAQHSTCAPPTSS